MLFFFSFFFFFYTCLAAIGISPSFSVQAFDLRTQSSLRINQKVIYLVSVISAFLSFKKKHIYLTISVSLRHEHDLNLAAFMVVLILPCNFTYKDAAAYTSLFNRVLPQDEYVVILLIFA